MFIVTCFANKSVAHKPKFNNSCNYALCRRLQNFVQPFFCKLIFFYFRIITLW